MSVWFGFVNKYRSCYNRKGHKDEAFSGKGKDSLLQRADLLSPGGNLDAEFGHTYFLTCVCPLPAVDTGGVNPTSLSLPSTLLRQDIPLPLGWR